MDKACRICMGSDSLKDLFKKNQSKDEPNLAEMLTECLNAEIKPDDNLTKKICTSCILDTQIAYRLKQRYKKTCQMVKEILEADEFIKSLESEDWKLTEINIKAEKKNRNKNLEEKNPNAKAIKVRKSQIGSDDNLRNDSSNLNEKMFQCKVCSKIFNTSYHLHQHMYTHIEDQQRPKTVQKKNHLKSRNKAKGPFKCSICEKTYSTRTNLKVHFIIHTNEKPYKCSYCKLAFSRWLQLKNHTAVHTGGHLHQCSICQRTFMTALGLEKHKKGHRAFQNQEKPTRLSTRYNDSNHVQRLYLSDDEEDDVN